MKGLVIWSQSNCRSTMALYRELIRSLKVPALITLWHYKQCDGGKDIREQIGFSHDEFADLPMEPVGENLRRGMTILKSHSTWHHMFCVWQGSPVYRRLIVEAKRIGCSVAVMCESPCNMSSGCSRYLKMLYVEMVLPVIARRVVSAADLFINYSGDDLTAAIRLGWKRNRIVPFGYFSPPIPGAKLVHRKSNQPFEILATGVLSKYRGADVLLEALRLLKMRGVDYHATITQKGHLLNVLKAKAKAFNLPVDFPGFMEMQDLIRLYESCSVYVGAGREEPWGMRLNDALQCGAPLVVSRGMGGVQLVDRYRCGLYCRAGDAVSLADALERLATDSALYRKIANSAVLAAEKIAPVEKAKELIGMLKIKEWL